VQNCHVPLRRPLAETGDDRALVLARALSKFVCNILQEGRQVDKDPCVCQFQHRNHEMV
jgi:hypothetical protein